MLKKEFEFVLQDVLIYSHEGKAGITAKKLLLRAPNTRLLSLSSKLSSIVMGALIKARESYKDNEDTKNVSSQASDIDGASIYMLVSGSIDSKQMSNFIDTFQELILSDNICLIDGKEQLTLDLFNLLDSRETLRLVGDYIANFLLPSIMSNSKKKN
jgi:hypothetical protein